LSLRKSTQAVAIPEAAAALPFNVAQSLAEAPAVLPASPPIAASVAPPIVSPIVSPVAPSVAPSVAPPPTTAREVAATPTAPTAPVVPSPPVDKKWVEIKSPMVGTFYRAPSPDEPPFTQVGDRISVGQTVCIIEAMKLMNEIEAEVSGQIMEILLQNGEPVEFDQPLMRVNPA
jgi:acetyl-CoA carboxylase biotin carboxyl carrier protein